MRSAQVFIYVWDQTRTGKKITAAIAAAAEEYSISVEMAKRIWRQWSDRYQLRTRKGTQIAS
jgi:hypothetical protein